MKNKLKNAFTTYLPTFISAAVIATVISSLFWYWFAVANRYHIFLYNHLGATPFDERTRSRYWMSGLVADGAAFLVYGLFNWLIARVAGIGYKHYHPPTWSRIWLLLVLPLIAIILFITETQNYPTLPFGLAVTVAIITVMALIPALAPGAIVVEQPKKFIGLTIIGAGLIPAFLLLRMIELPGAHLTSASTAYPLAIGGTLAGAIWLMGGTCILRSYFKLSLRWEELLLSGVCWSYLLLPLVHYLLLTPPAYHYISVSQNFFAVHYKVQFFCWGAAVTLSIIATKFSKFCSRSILIHQ